MNEVDRKVSVALREIADSLTKELEKVAGQRVNFSLFVFNSEPGSRVNYISNANRDDVAVALETVLKHWEEGMPDLPAHKLN